MRLNLLQSDSKRLLGALTSIASELRGIRVCLELLAVKERATPLPDQPDDADFLIPNEEDYARYEKLAQERPGISDEELVEPEAKKEEPRPADAFLPRFQR